MQWAFALPESASVTWGLHGLWLSRDDAFPVDDPFVVAHPDMFSLTPSRARSSAGDSYEQVPLSQVADTAPAARGKARANG